MVNIIYLYKGGIFMKTIKGVKMDLASCLELLKEIASNKGISEIGFGNIKNNMCEFNFCDGGIINIFLSNKGLTLSANYGKQQIIGSEIIKEFNDMLDNEFQRIKPSYAKYKVKLDKNSFKNNLKKAIVVIGGSIGEKNCTEYEYFQWEAVKDREKMSITLYNNGTLLIQGRTHMFWDNVCDWVEKELNSPVSEVLVRVTSDEHIVNKLKSESDEEVLDNAEQELKDRLGSSYSFLHNHDIKFLVASLSLLRYNKILPEYSPIIMPSFKALEGYTKKLLVKLYPSLEDEIYKPSFKFSKIFEYNNLFEIYVLRTEYYIDSAKTYALERLYAKLKDDRNPYMHSTAPIAKTCDNIEEASSIVDEVITLIADSYTCLSDVII